MENIESLFHPKNNSLNFVLTNRLSLGFTGSATVLLYFYLGNLGMSLIFSALVTKTEILPESINNSVLDI